MLAAIILYATSHVAIIFCSTLRILHCSLKSVNVITLVFSLEHSTYTKDFYLSVACFWPMRAGMSSTSTPMTLGLSVSPCTLW